MTDAIPLLRHKEYVSQLQLRASLRHMRVMTKDYMFDVYKAPKMFLSGPGGLAPVINFWVQSGYPFSDPHCQ